MKIKHPATWFVLCVSALGLGAVTVYVRHAPPIPKADEAPTLPSKPFHSAPEPASPEPKKVEKVAVFVPTMGNDGISFVRQDSEVPDGTDPRVFAVNEFLKAAQVTPDDAKALDVDVHDDGSAVIDFTKSFAQSYGAFDEKKLLDGLAAAMGQFQEIKQFIMMADGEPVKTLGNTDLTDPIPVIRPDAVPTKPSFSAPAGDKTPPAQP